MIRANRRAHSQPSLPTTEERYQLLRDFIETHHLSFQRAARFAVLHHRKDGIFDYDNMCMVVHLQYRPDSDRNPGMAFRVERSNFCPLASLLQLPECRQFWEAITAGRTAYMESCEADKDGAGVLPILYITRDHLLFSFMRQSRPSLQDAAASPRRRGMLACRAFRRLEKTGTKWKWVPFFDSANSDADDGADIPAVAAAGKTT
ncbi:hypothetical protein A0H81_04859 [Grifola frondosa]|uniref:Uncharacterized protein n=1 Tax=Grifola frondosa TaxID=5627 RepID=A0A1C7MF97_GRIFR|nr:hypothetical protein A0H81_04859 [Grifola frondosa]